MSEQAKTCPDCQCELDQIKLLDARFGPGSFSEPSYTTPDAAPNLFHAMPISGTVITSLLLVSLMRIGRHAKLGKDSA